jgi:hypothetical protein
MATVQKNGTSKALAAKKVSFFNSQKSMPVQEPQQTLLSSFNLEIVWSGNNIGFYLRSVS